MTENYYIYCITSKISDDTCIDLLGMDDKKITVIHYEDICALVSKTHKSRYEPTFENLQCHEKIASCAMVFSSVLPLSFSTISINEDSVILMLTQYYLQFIENLDRVKGKVELGVKIFYKLDYEHQDKFDKIENENPKSYMLKRYERYLNRKLQLKAIEIVLDEINKELIEIACESNLVKPFKNNLIFNGAYLVYKTNIEQFTFRVEELKNKHANYKFVFSGPWSPYHFVKLTKVGDENE